MRLKTVAYLKACDEAKIAARWWRNRLEEKPVHDSGSDIDCQLINLMSEMAAERSRRLTGEQLDEFEQTLAVMVQRIFVNADHWQPDKPDFGLTLRTLGVDYNACGMLRAAYQHAGGGIQDAVWPIKTVMWISPDSVKVRLGYRGSEQELMVDAVTQTV